MKIEIVIIIILSLLLLVSTFISTKGKLTDSKGKGLKSITKNGRFLIIINFFILLFLVVQYLISEYKAQIKQEAYYKNQERRDAILKKSYDSSLLVIKLKFDTSNIKIITTITEVLGKYGYSLDSTSKTLVKILRDSSKTRVILPENPVLSCISFEYYNLTERIPTYKITFANYDASSSGFNLKVTFVGKDSLNEYYFIGNGSFLKDYDRMPKNSTKGFYYKIDNDSAYNMIYFRVKGSYKNSDQNKTFNINELYYYNKKGKTFGMITGKTRDEIINFIENYEKFLDYIKASH